MQAADSVKSPFSQNAGWRLNGRLLVVLALDVVAWALIIAAVWGGLHLLKVL